MSEQPFAHASESEMTIAGAWRLGRVESQTVVFYGNAQTTARHRALYRYMLCVAMIDGAARMTDAHFEITVFTGGVSCRTNTYYYSTYDDPAIRSVALGDYDVTGADLIAV